MKFSKKSCDYASQLYSRAMHALDSYVHAGDHEELHKARVALKRLFTLWRMNRRKMCRECRLFILIWKSVFRQAGLQRSEHLMDSLNKKYAPGRIAPIGGSCSDYALLQVYLTVRSLLEVRQKQLVDMASEASFDECMKFCRKETGELLVLLITGDKEFWHPVRKKAKRVSYIFELVHEAGKPMPDIRLYRLLERMQNVIGHWHDLKQFQSNYKSAETDTAKLESDIGLAEKKVNELTVDLFNSCSPEWLPDYLR